MSDTQYFRAASVADAINALKAANGDGLIIAGGIAVSTLFNQRLASPSVLVDISRIESLKAIKLGSNGLSIGALTTHTQLLTSEHIRSAAPLLSEIAVDISCPRLRNRGTLGGSVCTIGGQGDPATGLIALDAKLHISGPKGARSVALEDFYDQDFKVDLAADEIVESIFVPPMKKGTRFGYCKHGPRNAMDFTQITTSVVCSPGSDGLYTVRIGMNGVGYTPNRPRASEALLGSKEQKTIDWEKIEHTLAREIEPQGDLVYSESSSGI